MPDTKIDIRNLADRDFCNSMCDVLQQYLPKNIIITRMEMIEDAEKLTRTIRFLYSRVEKGLENRQAGREPTHDNLFPVDVTVSRFNTHIPTELILSKFALVR